MIFRLASLAAETDAGTDGPGSAPSAVVQTNRP